MNTLLQNDYEGSPPHPPSPSLSLSPSLPPGWFWVTVVVWPLWTTSSARCSSIWARRSSTPPRTPTRGSRAPLARPASPLEVSHLSVVWVGHFVKQKVFQSSVISVFKIKCLFSSPSVFVSLYVSVSLSFSLFLIHLQNNTLGCGFRQSYHI